MNNNIDIIVYSSKKNKITLRNNPAHSNKFNITFWERQKTSWHGKGIEIDSAELSVIQSGIKKFYDLATELVYLGDRD